MSKEDVFAAVQEIVSETADIEVDEVSLQSSLMNDIGLSSMDIMSMISDIEKAYKIKISEKMLRTFVTVQDIVECVAAKTEE